MNPDPSTERAVHRADWYPDPTKRFEFRYHNGQAWTGDVSADGHRFLDPLPSSRDTAVITRREFVGPDVRGPRPRPGPGPGPDINGPHQRLEPIGASLAAFVLGVSSVLVGWVPFLGVLAGVGAIVGLILGIRALRRDAASRREGGQNHRGHGYALTGVILAPFGLVLAGVGVWLSVVTLREVDRFTNVGAYTITRTCDVEAGSARAAGTITNDSSTRRSYHFVVEFDRKGTSAHLASADVSVDNVEAGAAATWNASAAVSAAQVDCSVSNVTGPVPFGQN